MLIYAHTGLSDERSAGNENADKLAVAGAEKWGQIAGIVAVRAPAGSVLGAHSVGLFPRKPSTSI